MIVYLVTNTVNGKKYVGKTVRPLARRWCQHTSRTKHGCNLYFHNAIRKYGSESFALQVLFTCNDAKTLNLYEQGHIKFYDTRNPDKGYNLTDGGEGTVGFKPSLETRKKLSASGLGKKQSPEWIAKRAAARRGSKLSPEQIERCRLAQTGKKMSEEAKKKISIANTGRIRSEETRARMSLAKEYKTHCHNGHLRTPDNTAISRGSRLCRLCARQRVRKYDHKRRGK